MLQRTRRFIPTMVLGAVGVSGALALAADSATDDLKAQISALQAKVEALEAKQVSSADVDATVSRVLADADSRSQLMASEGFTAGYNSGKFLIQSADGSFVLNPQLQFQERYIANYREDVKEDGNSSWEDGFEIRRMKLGFGGSAITPDLTYLFVWATSRNQTGTFANTSNNNKDTSVGAGTLSLEDAWVRYRFASEWAVYGGQFKDPWNHTNNVSSKRYMAADYGLVDQLLGDGQTFYVQGVGLAWETKPLRAQFAFHDGANSANSNFANQTYDYGVTGRGEWQISGDNWKQYDQFTALGNKSDLLVAGVGGDYSSGDTKNVLFHSADLQWDPIAAPGLALFGEYIGQAVNANDDTPNAYNYGFLVQAGYLLTQRWEVFGRYDLTMLDSNALPPDTVNDIHEITTGVNYYVNGHAAKFTADVTYLPNGTGGQSADGLGILPTSKTSDEAEVVFRVQFQLLL